MSSAITGGPQTAIPVSSKPPVDNRPVVMPTLLGIGYGNYDARPNNFILSFLLHALAIAGLLVATHFFVTKRDEIEWPIPTEVKANRGCHQDEKGQARLHQLGEIGHR